MNPCDDSVSTILRFLFSATPVLLIAAGDAFFFGFVYSQPLSVAGVLIQEAILAVAALVIVPNKTLRLVPVIGTPTRILLPLFEIKQRF